MDKNMIVNMLRERGNHAEAQQAEQELPQDVQPAEHADLLSRFGIDPQELIAKFGGGGGGLGGGLGDIAKKFGG